MGKVADAVRRDLEDIRARAPQIADSGLGAAALALATEIDRPKNSATSKSMCAKALLDTLDRLRELAPAKPAEDGLDDITKRRADRLRGRSAAA